MKKLFLIYLSFLTTFGLYSQNAIVGPGFSTGWGGASCPTGNSNFTYFSSSFGGSFGQVLTPNSTGFRYFRFGIDWSATLAQRTINLGTDVSILPNQEYTLNPNCTTSGSIYINVPNSNYRYVAKTLNAGTNPTGTFIMFEVQGAVRSVNSVTQIPIASSVSSGDAVLVTATLDGAVSSGQAVYLRYTTDNWASSSIIPMVVSGTNSTASIPSQVMGSQIRYYIFTSSPNVTLSNSNVDFYTFNGNTNSGSNYSYTVSSTSSVTVAPTYPDDVQSVTVTFNATGTPLAGASAVYFHAGVSTTVSSPTSFSYTKGNWGLNDGVGVMTNVGINMWSITLNTGLRSYFGVPNERDIFGLNFLFRNASGTLKEDNGGANFYRVVNPGSYFTITNPTNPTEFVAVNTSINAIASSNVIPSNWNLVEIDPVTNVFIANIATASGGLTFSNTISVTNNSLRKFRITADYSGLQKSKTFQLSGFGAVVEAPRPSWTKLGVNYHPTDATKATLILHAPTYTRYKKGLGAIGGTGNTTAKNVIYVVGDFNNWTPSETYKLNRDRDGWNGTTDSDNDGDRGDYWWIELSGLNPGQEYVFQYLIDGVLQVADPYSAKISDPDDFQISSSTYPGLVTYRPQASDRASVLQTNKSSYNWTAPSFAKPTNDRLNIYEMHFRDFTDEGTYLAAIPKLDYIKSLGINAIHVMPVSEFEGNSSWGYNPNFYFAADKAYGTENDLKTFIDACHQRGMQVYNDVVLNHTFYSGTHARMYWNSTLNRPATENPWLNAEHKMVRNQAGWWGADWNHESEHMQNLVDSILGYWISEYKFDGFRFDFTKGFGQTNPNDFPPGDDWASAYNQDRVDLLKRMVDRMWGVYPGTVAIFEHLANSSEDKVLADHGILMWSGVGHHNDLKRLILGFNSDDTNIYTSGVYNAPSRNFNLANWMSYGESHDEERLAYELSQFYNGAKTTANIIDRLKIAYGFNLFLPGPRMIWQFGELGYDVSINFNGRTGEKPVRWNYYDDAKRRELYTLMSRIFKIRNDHNMYAATPDYGNIGVGAGNIATPRVMRLSNGAGKNVIIVANLDPSNSRNAFPNFPSQGNWFRYNGAVDGLLYNVNAGNQSSAYSLQTSEMMVFTNFEVIPCNNVTSVANSGEASLRNAINCAAENGTITFAVTGANKTISLSSPIIINKNLTIQVPQGENYIIDGSSIMNQSLFTIMPGKQVIIVGANIKCANSTSLGTCINNSGTLTLNNTSLEKNISNSSISLYNQSGGIINIVNNVVIE